MDNRHYEPEQRLVIDTFQKSFAGLRKQNIVLYGIGKNTEAVLSGTDGFSFIGLMDQNTTGQTIFGQRVLSDEEVIALHPVIVIIARESVVNIIYKRIQYLSIEYGIAIYDFQGKLLGSDSLVYGNGDLPYWDASAGDLRKRMAEYDIISFDIFDTLLMRRVLQPEDVFALVEKHLAEKNMKIPFAKLRVQAEQRLRCPNLDEIYEEMGRLTGYDDIMLQQMKECECKTDAAMLIPRTQMCELLQEALGAGKAVYLISDMYYPKAYLEKLLNDNGIVGYRDIFVSCDIKMEKSDGSLFRWFIEKAGHGRKLHIGDNRRSDVQKAMEAGMDAYHIYSGYELLMASSMQEVLADVKTLQQRCMLGLIVSRLFENPFALHSSRGYVCIENISQVGYCFVAPILTEFVRWFLCRVKELDVSQILFPSRDGYLMQKLYQMMSNHDMESVYFRTSRRAVSVAGIRDTQDVQRVAARGYQGTHRAYVKSRFGVDMDLSDERGNEPVKSVQDEYTKKVIEDYETAILQRAQMERSGYLSYLDGLGILKQEKQVLFDFVAGGTVQYNLEKLLQRNLTGLYFATMNLPNSMYGEDTDRILSAYGNIRSYGTQNMLGKYYLFLETILIDDKETFSHIDEDGIERFVEESAKSNREKIRQLQEAVLAYAEEYSRYFGNTDKWEYELDFADRLFGTLFSKQCKVDEQVKAVFQNDDVYDGIKTYRLWND